MKYITKPFITIIALLSVVVSIFLPTIAVQAQAVWPAEPEIESPAGIIMELDTGTVLFEKDSLTAHAPASITKIMTALVAIENCPLDEVVTFSDNAIYSVEIGSSSISRDFGEEMTMEQCLYGLMLESANECANAIAEHVGGSIENFATMMNKKAKELGCKNTNFINPHGLYDENHYTCAMDMALIAREAYLNPTFALITGSKRYTIPPTNKHEDPTPLNNHHAMLNYYRTNKYIDDRCVGGKTGYTEVAQSTLVTYAKKDGMTLICVIMHAASPSHYLDTKALFDYYFGKFELHSASEYIAESSNTTQKLTSLVEDANPVQIDGKGSFILPAGEGYTNLTTRFKLGSNNESLLGVVEFWYDGKRVGAASIMGDTSAKAGYPFHNINVEQGGSGDKVLLINPIKVIAITVSSVAVIIILIIMIRKFSDFSFKIRRIRNERKSDKMDFPIINRDYSKKYRK